MKDIQVNKRSAWIVNKLVNTLKRLDMAHKDLLFLGRGREDDIIKAWKFGKKYGNK